MKTRMLGRTGFQVSEIGHGTWGLGGDLWRGVDAADAQRAVYAAVDAGVTLIDTALAYGEGRSEQLVGEVIRDLRARDTVLVATKVPPLDRRWPPADDARLEAVLPAGYVMRCVEDSLRNLRAEVIGLAQLHVWHDRWLAASAWPAVRGTMQRAIDQGKVLAWGVSINAHDPDSALEILGDPLIGTVQVIYNIFDQSPARALLARARDENVGVIVRCPFDEGALTGALTAGSRFPADDWRNRYFRGDRLAELEPRIAALRALLGDEARTLPELALRFCLAPAEVGCVIPGMRRREHVSANVAVSDGRRLSDALLARLAEHAWDKNWYL